MVFQRLKNPVIDHSESQDGVCDYAESSLCCSKESSGEVTGYVSLSFTSQNVKNC